jgi:hypothetical protein
MYWLAAELVSMCWLAAELVSRVNLVLVCVLIGASSMPDDADSSGSDSDGDKEDGESEDEEDDVQEIEEEEQDGEGAAFGSCFALLFYATNFTPNRSR